MGLWSVDGIAAIRRPDAIRKAEGLVECSVSHIPAEAFRELHAEGEHLLFDLLGVGEILYDALPSISHRYRHFSSLHDPAPHRGRDFQISD